MLAIGLMSGTSLDGVDASLIETDGESSFAVHANFHLPYPTEFQEKLRQVIATHKGWLEVEIELTHYHAQCIFQLFEIAPLHAKKIEIIGFHGQTIYHNPSKSISWQIGNPHLLKELTGINVVSDFRRRDIATGGQGAPLVPIFHQCLVRKEEKPVAVLNIGGIANITYIGKEQTIPFPILNPEHSRGPQNSYGLFEMENGIIAFDCGPGNALINDAMLQHYGKLFDDKGEIAASGTVNNTILEQILAHEFFKSPPPKSLDRNDFKSVQQLFIGSKPADIIATLTMLTARSILESFKLLPNSPEKIYLCGGGTHNTTLVGWLQDKANIRDIKELGLDPDFIEAQAFAYLAVRYLRKLPSSFPSTTKVNFPTNAGVLFE